MVRTLFFGAVFMLLLVNNGFAARRPAGQPVKTEIIARLRALQTRQIQEITTLEDTVRKTVRQSTSVSLKGDQNAANGKILRLVDQLGEVDKKRAELLARREFIDQLILLIDTKYSGQPLQTFLEHSLLDLSVADLTHTQGSSDAWRFNLYLSIAVREVPESREDVLSIVESYLNFSGVLNPRTPTEFAASRHYTNGAQAIPARPIDPATLGDFLEPQGKAAPRALHPTNPNQQRDSKADIELRLKPLPGSAEGESSSGTSLPPSLPPEAESDAQQMYISPRLRAVIRAVN